ncbi:MAG: hypothetical protein GY757_12895 [bacterium]|nr:hypothetical protein [bacterium]
MKTWKDAQLGTFTYDEYTWTRSFELPAFSVFRYFGFNKPLAQNGNPVVELMFEADDERDIPTEGEITVAGRTINNHQQLVNEGTEALFNDFLGKGPGSGMWWHGDIEHVREIVAESFDDPQSIPLDNPPHLHMLMGQPSIMVQESGYGYDQACAIISFEAVFEVEHGIGMLTDGNRILGVGYQMDVSPFAGT